MAAYGGSLSAGDVAVWGLARTLNLRAWQREHGGGSGDGEADALQALLEGPLSETW